MKFEIDRIRNNKGDELRYKGAKAIQMSPERKPRMGFTRGKVIREVNQIVSNLRAKNFDGQMLITLDHGNHSYFSGQFTDILTEEPDIIKTDGYTGYVDPEVYSNFIVYVIKNGARGVQQIQQAIQPQMRGGAIEIAETKAKPFTVHGYSDKESKLIVARFLNNGQYDYCKEGITYTNQPPSFIQDINSKPRSSGYLVIPVRYEDKRELIEIYNEHIKIADVMKEKTNNEVNLYKTGSLPNTSKFHFKRLMPEIELESITAKEAEWIMNAFVGANQCTKPFKGKGYGYDFNSFYLSILNSNFRIPIKQGTFKKITFAGKISSNVTYGIYRVKITGNINPFIFKLTRRNYYTSIDINRAVKLGYEVKYIIDDDDNALVYGKDDFILSKNLFGKYIDYFYRLKLQGVDGAKQLLTCLWGWATQTNEMTLSNDGNYDIDDGLQIIAMKPIDDTGKTCIKVLKKQKAFAYAFARFKPFLFSRSRELIGQTLEKQMDDVVRVYVDGFIMSKPLENANMGFHLGELKYESKYCGEIEIKSNGKVIV